MMRNGIIPLTTLWLGSATLAAERLTSPVLPAPAHAAAAAPNGASVPLPAADIEPAVATSKAAARKPAVSASGNTGRATDRVELENTQITGNRELPKVMYVVPWKKPDLGEFTGRPAKSLLDELLAPVDRDVFKRQVRYFEALRPDTAVVAPPVTTGSSGNSGAAAPRTGDEK